MIRVTIYQDDCENIKGFHSEGHAEYADPGYDIVCAAVSILCINTVNSIEEFTDVTFSEGQDAERGMIDFEVTQDATAETNLLFRSMILGLQGIQDNYGDEYLILEFKEV